MTTARTRRRGPLVLLVLVATLAITGCKATDSTLGVASPPAGPVSAGGEALDAAPPSPMKNPAPAITGPGTLVATFPGAPRPYAEAVIKAWTHDDINTLGSLTTAGVQEQMLEIPEPLDPAWTYLRCDGTAGSSYCLFANAAGDELTLRISHALLGRAHAAIGVTLDPTTYPMQGVDYVKEFVAAWQVGNTARMLKLSKSSIVDQLGPAPVNPTYPAPVCCGGGLLQVTVAWAASSVRFDVGTTLLGGPHAIVGYAPGGLGFTEG